MQGHKCCRKKAPPPQLPKLTDTLSPSNTAVIQRNRRMAGITKQTVTLRPPQTPPQTETMVTIADVATSSHKPATINEEYVELDAWLASFSGVAAAEESAQKTTTRPITLENLAATTEERLTKSQGARSSRYTEDMVRKEKRTTYTIAKRLNWVHHYVEKVEFT